MGLTAPSTVPGSASRWPGSTPSTPSTRRGTRTIRSRGARTRIRSLLAALVTALVAAATLAGPASSAEWVVLCTGYDACQAAGRPHAGYKQNATTSYWRQSTGHNCTNYVAYRLVRAGMANTKPAQLSGNAFNWGSAFASQTDDAPAVGAVAWWGQSFSGTGHVAYVEQVVSADQIIVSEDNWGGEFRWRSISRGGGLWPDGFIHLRDVGSRVAPPATYPRYRPVTPARVVDTRAALGAAGRLAAGSDISILVNGRAGLPRTAVGAVVVNLTAVAPSGPGSLLAYRSGTTPGTATSLSFGAGAVVANQAVVGVGSDGRIRLRSTQATDVLVDVVGWYPAHGNLSPTVPTRVLDTRSRTGTSLTELGPGGRIDLKVTGTATVPTSGVDSVLLDVTAVAPTGNGYLTAWPTGGAVPNASALNFERGTDRSGLVVARLGAGGSVSLRSSAATDLVADVVGFYRSGTDFRGLVPARLLDTRSAVGVTDRGALDAGGTLRLKVTGRGGVPATGVKAVVLTLTVTGSTQPGYLTAYPAYTARPTTSNLNHEGGQTVANTAFVTPSSDGYVDVYVQQSTHVLADVQGYLVR